MTYLLSHDKIAAAGLKILAGLTASMGPPLEATSSGPLSVAGSARWGHGWFRALEEPDRIRFVFRRRVLDQSGELVGQTTWVTFQSDPLGSGLWRQLVDADAHFAIGEEGETLDLHGDAEAAAIREIYQSGDYFMRTVDMTRHHVSRSGTRPCELCLLAIQKGETYVERLDKQSGDNRRSHLACAQRAVDVATREEAAT